MAVRRQPIPFGKYYLLDRINIGGMAEVWRAKTFGEQGFERLVAIKRILPNIAEDDEFVAMFIDEAKITVQLTHANVAQVFDLGKIGESYFIAMEYVAGKDLRAIFDRCRRKNEQAPIPMVCFMVARMCEGLDYAHRKRDPSGMELHIVHRDVSPQNCLVSFDGEIKVIDFGIAKAANKATKTQAGILKGKFGYMSPEQVRGLPLDQRSDVFAAGVVLYEMLTGERLFVGDSDFSVLEKVRQVEILPPTKYNRRIPEPLEKIVLKALTKDADDRYQWASDLADALQRFILTSNSVFSRKDLAQYMRSTFAEDVDKEKVRQAEYAKVKLPTWQAAPADPRHAGSRLAPQAAPPRLTAASAQVETAPEEVSERTVIEGKDVYADSGPKATPAAFDVDPASEDGLALAPALEDPLLAPPLQRNGASRGRPLPPGIGQPSGQPVPPLPAKAFKPRVPELAKVGALLNGGASRKWVAVGAGGALLTAAAVAALLLPGARGGLLVEFEPADGQVFVDGVEICAGSPCDADDLAPGKHRIEIRRESYEPLAQEIEIPRADIYRFGPKIALRPVVQKLPISVASEPSDAEVKIDGKVIRALGSKPPARVEQAVGKPFDVEVSKPGYQSWKKTMTLSATDKPAVDLWAELTRLQMSLQFDSTPQGAKLVIDDRPAGTTPASVEDLDPSVPHSVVLQKDGYKDATHTILPGTASGKITKVLERK